MEWKYLIAGIIAPFFWLIVLSISLWLVRRFCPGWERVLWSKPTDWPRMLREALSGHRAGAKPPQPRG